MERFDITIIGAGPAGALAAFIAAQRNLKVLLIEKETLPRYKTCGGGLVFRGRNRLPFDISSLVEKEFAEINVYFENQTRHFTAKRDQPIISMVMRDNFDAKITQLAMEQGAVLLENTKLSDIDWGKDLTLNTSKGQIQTRYLIAADGALGQTAKMAGWVESRNLIPALEYEVRVPETNFEKLSQTVRFDVDTVPHGYAWCFPKTSHLSIGVACMRKERIDLKKYYRKYLEKLGIEQVLSASAHGFQIPVSPRKEGFVKNNVFLTGDAAGFADPLTAEGISNALFSGQLAAESIIDNFNQPEQAALAYQSSIERLLLPELKTSQLLAWVFYAQPKLRSLLINRYGQRGCEFLTDVFMGSRVYPDNLMEKLKQNLPFLRIS